VLPLGAFPGFSASVEEADRAAEYAERYDIIQPFPFMFEMEVQWQRENS
jgi:hypothetical protein